MKLMGPPVTMVIVPNVTPELSALDVATMVTVWGVLVVLFCCGGVMAVGTVLGAVYTARFGLFASGVIVPQVGLQVGSCDRVVVTPLVVVGMFCVSSQVTPLLWMSLVRVTKNCWLSPVGTETLTGWRVTVIPDVSWRLIEPLLLGFCLDVAVITIRRPGYLV